MLQCWLYRSCPLAKLGNGVPVLSKPGIITIVPHVDSYAICEKSDRSGEFTKGVPSCKPQTVPGLLGIQTLWDEGKLGGFEFGGVRSVEREPIS